MQPRFRSSRSRSPWMAAICAVATLTTVGLTRVHASSSTLQTPLAGTSIPKFVDPLPTFVGRRVNATVPLQVNMEEFQQKVLPASVYAPLAPPFNNGTFLWGYDV